MTMHKKLMAHHAADVFLQLLLGTSIGAGCAVVGALFSMSLHRAEAARALHPKLLYGLPVLGLILGFVYDRYGRSISGGNNLIIDRLCDGGPTLPKRMVPFALIGTVAIHLCGGSVGQEGTAMQLGAAWADNFARALRLPQQWRGMCLAAGVGGGFAAVFGAPAAATVFALEFAVAGAVRTSLMPCVLAASLTAHTLAQALGAPQPLWPSIDAVPFTPSCAWAWLCLSLAAAVAATLFARLTDHISRFSSHFVPRLTWRMLAGGTAFAVLAQLTHSDLYLGGGAHQTLAVLQGDTLPPLAWLGKLLLTALCLGSGFLGGEVTPLLFMGAALGHTLAPYLLVPAPMAAAVGMAAMLSGATHAPLAWTLLVVERMGHGLLPHVLLASVLAAAFAGKQRIYAAQRGH